MATTHESLPYFTQGQVVKGFGRGSKELGIPTANFSQEIVDRLPSNFECGVYFGWAKVDSGPVHKMVMSVGWNPFYKNIKKSMETYIINKFSDDFYGSNLTVAILGYIRPEKNFNGLDELIGAIQDDIEQASRALDEPRFEELRNHSIFRESVDGAPNCDHV